MPFPFRGGAPVFVHLHCHSHYSFLRGVASPEEIVAAAVEQKMPAVALTDTNGLYAAVSFYQAAKKNRHQSHRRRGVGCRILCFERAISKLQNQNSTFAECASNAAGGGHGRLQQFVPTRDAAALGHHQAVTKHSFPGNRWPGGDIRGVGGAQPRRDRIGTCESSAVDILRFAQDDKRKEEGGRGKPRP